MPPGRAARGRSAPRRSAVRAAVGDRLRKLLRANDIAKLEASFRAFLASIPHQWHANNPIASHGAHCASGFHSCFCFAGAGLETVVEDGTSRERRRRYRSAKGSAVTPAPSGRRTSPGCTT